MKKASEDSALNTLKTNVGNLNNTANEYSIKVNFDYTNRVNRM